MISDNARGWCLLLSIVGKVAALNYPIWFPHRPGIAAACFLVIHVLAFVGFWPSPPADAPRTGNIISACVGGVFIGTVVFVVYLLGTRGMDNAAWWAYGINFGAWFGWFALLNPGSKNEGA